MSSRSLSFQRNHYFVTLSRLNITKLDLMETNEHKRLWLCVHFLSSQLCNEAQKWHTIQNAFLQLLSTCKNYHPTKDNDWKVWFQSWDAQQEMHLYTCCVGNTCRDQLSSVWIAWLIVHKQVLLVSGSCRWLTEGCKSGPALDLLEALFMRRRPVGSCVDGSAPSCP